MGDERKELNDRFGVGESLRFVAGPGDLTVLEVATPLAEASLTLQGAHLYQFQPAGEKPVIFTSRDARFGPGQAIRGGIPVCWPWFAKHPERSDLPSHGVARDREWCVQRTSVRDDGVAEVSLVLSDSEDTRKLWPHAFSLELTLGLGKGLSVDLMVRNSGTEPFSWTGALHSYFSVSEVRNVRVLGLEGTTYLDKLAGDARVPQPGSVQLEGAADRVYLDTDAPSVIEDPDWDRRIRLAKRGSRTTVVWNPGPQGAAALGDFADDEWPGMICVETANAGGADVTVRPGGECVMGVDISLE